MNHQYDAIILLGTKPDTTTWRFPRQIYACLDKTASLYKTAVADMVIVSGNYALSFDRRGIKQPFRECDELARELQTRGVPAAAILREGESKDTIANLYYVKRLLAAPRGFRHLLFVVADFRVERLRYLCDKVFGSDYAVEFATIPAPPDEVYPEEALTLKRTREFLAPMTPGDDKFLDDKFYAAGYYLYSRPRSTPAG